MTGRRTKLLLVNPNTSTTTTAMMVSAARGTIELLGEDAVVVGATAASGAAMIVDPAALGLAASASVAAGMAGVEEHRPDAVIVAAFGDPGATELRAALGIPVFGIGEASVRKAARGGRFAIVTSTPQLREALESLVETHCPTADFAGVFVPARDPLELAQDPDRNVEALDGAIDAAVAAGAGCVVIGGGPLTDAARRLAARTDVDVVEPVPCAVRLALATLRSTAAVLASRP